MYPVTRSPAALPTVEHSSIRQDLHRRDFTINAMAVSLLPAEFGMLFDPYGGEGDLFGEFPGLPHDGVSPPPQDPSFDLHQAGDLKPKFDTSALQFTKLLRRVPN